MATNNMVGVTTVKVLTFNPKEQTFKEYDKKFRNFKPELKYWEDVLTKENVWDDKDAAGNDKYTAEEKEIIKNTDRVARAMYIQGNSGANEVCTDELTAYAIREKLKKKYQRADLLGLAELTAKFNNIVRGGKFKAPDV